MIDYDKYQFHIKVIGSKEEFIKHIEDFKKAAPYYTEEDIVSRQVVGFYFT